MTAAEFSVLAVTIGFIALVVWVYSPGRRKRLESYGSMPLEDDHGEQPEQDGGRS